MWLRVRNNISRLTAYRGINRIRAANIAERFTDSV